MPISLVLADDHPIVLRGLEGLFEAETDLQVVATCVDGAEALASVRTHRPDVVVLDLKMPRLDGLQVLQAMHREGLNARVILLTAEADDDQLLTCLRLGVKGFMLKEQASAQLVNCVRRVMAGGQCIDTRISERALDALLRREDAAKGAAGDLTPREAELVRLVARGLRNRDIAARLAIGEGTVKAHLHNVFRKLGVETRVELTLYAQEHGLT